MNSGARTAAEFTETLERRLGQRKLDAAYDAFRRALIDLLVAEIEIEVPQAIVRGEMDRLLHDFSHRLSEQDISIADYLQIGRAHV